MNNYNLSEKERQYLMSSANAEPLELSDELVRDIANALPAISGLVAGMSMVEFDAIMRATACSAHEAFKEEFGDAFGSKSTQQKRSFVKAKDVEENAMCGSYSSLNYA